MWQWRADKTESRINKVVLFAIWYFHIPSRKTVNMRWQGSADDYRRVSSIFMGLLALCCLAKTQSSYHKKFEYKLSFKGPHLVQRDGTIPFWEHFGSMHSFLMLPYVICSERFSSIIFDVMDINNHVFWLVRDTHYSAAWLTQPLYVCPLYWRSYYYWKKKTLRHR